MPSLLFSLSKETPRFGTELDVMKFLCKDFWSAVFRKQVDNLKTNHQVKTPVFSILGQFDKSSFFQGVYVVNDNQFWLLTPYARDDEWKKEAPKYSSFSCGLIRGALSNLGITAFVNCEIMVLPGVKFNVHTQQKI